MFFFLLSEDNYFYYKNLKRYISGNLDDEKGLLFESFVSKSRCQNDVNDSFFFFFFIYAMEPSAGLLAACTLHARTNNTETIPQTFVQGLHRYTTEIHVCYLHTYN